MHQLWLANDLACKDNENINILCKVMPANSRHTGKKLMHYWMVVVIEQEQLLQRWKLGCTKIGIHQQITKLVSRFSEVATFAATWQCKHPKTSSFVGFWESIGPSA